MTENTLTLEQRIEILERELIAIKFRIDKDPKKPWWHKIVGFFENDSAFDEIYSLGKSIREQERADVKS